MPRLGLTGRRSFMVVGLCVDVVSGASVASLAVVAAAFHCYWFSSVPHRQTVKFVVIF